jgi:tripartite-type tricarboxylate transporter receptor subunit TctC
MKKCMMTMIATMAVGAVQGHAADAGFPTRPIRLIVTAAAGGNADTVARITGHYLSDALRVPVVIDNRPGANSMLATGLTVRSAPDGYTLVLVSNAHATNPSLVSKMPYDTLKDLAPVSLLATTSNVLVVNPGVGVSSVKELIALAKAKPAQLNYGSSGNGSSANLAAELFNSLAGVRIVQVPYKGTAQLLGDVISGQIQLSFSSMATVMLHIKSSKLRALGVTGVKRAPAAPDVPTIAEAGVPGYRSINWNGLLAPAATPKNAIAILNREIVRQFKTPEAQERFANVGIEALHGTPAEFDVFIREEIKQWAKVIKQAGIKVDLE